MGGLVLLKAHLADFPFIFPFTEVFIFADSAEEMVLIWNKDVLDHLKTQMSVFLTVLFHFFKQHKLVHLTCFFQWQHKFQLKFLCLIPKLSDSDSFVWITEWVNAIFSFILGGLTP